jgi:hypothetical protein
MFVMTGRHASFGDNGQTLGGLFQHLDMTRQAVTKHLPK